MARELSPLCVVRLPRRRVGPADAGEGLLVQRRRALGGLGRRDEEQVKESQRELEQRRAEVGSGQWLGTAYGGHGGV